MHEDHFSYLRDQLVIAQVSVSKPEGLAQKQLALLFLPLPDQYHACRKVSCTPAQPNPNDLQDTKGSGCIRTNTVRSVL